MSAAQKLTKKQKKALAFRERKGKGKAKALDEDNDVPVEENQDNLEAETEGGTLENQERHEEPEAETVGKTERAVEGSQHAKKRKREEVKSAEDGEKPKPKKKRKTVDGEGGAVGSSADTVMKSGEQAAETNTKGKQRYILFVGNLKYSTNKEAVEKHFAACDPPPTVRLMTPKPTPGKSSAKSKGFAFLEFTSRNALQQALKLHQSELEGRMINVELTAGGGGKSESRVEKLKKRNRELHEQREKRLKKQTGSKDGAEGEAQLSRPQRYSATSGVGQAPPQKRTWTVGEPIDGEAKPSKKRGKRPPRALGTGVNAIPVG